jgi:acyl-coenzyme A thioesterase PaaI-like protein
VINRGKNVGYIECDVTDQNGKRIATANSTCFVLRGEAAGREKSS